jgi:hypothetical protein
MAAIQAFSFQPIRELLCLHNQKRWEVLMLPDASHWHSEARYARVEKISASDLAWEWLRRNEAYDEDFAVYCAEGADKAALSESIRRRWGVRFPRQSLRRSC